MLGFLCHAHVNETTSCGSRCCSLCTSGYMPAIRAVAGIVTTANNLPLTNRNVTIHRNITSSWAINNHHTKIIRMLPHLSNVLTYRYDIYNIQNWSTFFLRLFWLSLTIECRLCRRFVENLS